MSVVAHDRRSLGLQSGRRRGHRLPAHAVSANVDGRPTAHHPKHASRNRKKNCNSPFTTPPTKRAPPAPPAPTPNRCGVVCASPLPPLLLIPLRATARQGKKRQGGDGIERERVGRKREHENAGVEVDNKQCTEEVDKNGEGNKGERVGGLGIGMKWVMRRVTLLNSPPTPLTLAIPPNTSATSTPAAHAATNTPCSPRHEREAQAVLCFFP
ncbi:hypothetical protein B0H17DRAFT_109564 [Mycena rosella]|uniref:Uncharacterized protein n=1 Tax=Mycena rosella TaxID=1033263 RepID=A0AAD7D4C4_MYCRO|nr:hypothetical protein B0H17DRAFT_109564 [Mycena rosella]